MKVQLAIRLFTLPLLTGIMGIAAPGLITGQTPAELFTPWGDPDLQGTWSYASLTRLQRPTTLGDKEFYTPEEAAQVKIRSEQDSVDIPGDPVGWYDKGEVSPNLRTSLIVDPPNGRLPLTEAALERQQQKRAAYMEFQAKSWLDLTAWDRCITYHGVPAISTGYNNAYLIVQSPDHVAIYSETIHDVRIIPLHAPSPLDAKIRQWNGSSRGYWDGDTLVVETSNYSRKTELRFPSSRNMRAVERFTRVSEDLIDYEFTIEDPEVYTQIWSAVRPMPALDDYTIFEYACHEGNRSMYNLLRGARLQEAQKAGAERVEGN
ncbi:MAG: hypothetical protein JKY98_09235 [Gammaproteobacteria bacterium]|nr:hypothetical protein [Gammaproteobacteria bacterium]